MHVRNDENAYCSHTIIGRQPPAKPAHFFPKQISLLAHSGNNLYSHKPLENMTEIGGMSLSNTVQHLNRNSVAGKIRVVFLRSRSTMEFGERLFLYLYVKHGHTVSPSSSLAVAAFLFAGTVLHKKRAFTNAKCIN